MIRNLDPILTNAQPGQIINLERGLYTTMGVTSAQVENQSGPQLKPGVSLVGHPGGTTILCTRAHDGPEVSVLYGNGDAISVSDLIVDCGPSSTPTNKRNGVYLLGKSSVVSGVGVRRSWGCYANMRESFGISVSSKKEDGAKISECSVSDISGDYQTAIQGYSVQSCAVEFPSEQKPGFRVAYNVGDSSGSGVINCSSRWAYVGVYWDWKSCVYLTVSGCTFYGCRSGLYLNAQQLAGDTESKFAREVIFESNDIYLNPELPEVAAFMLVHSTPDGIYRQDNTLHAINNVTIQNNRVRFIPGEIKTRTRYASNASSFLDPSKRTPDLGISGVRFIDNDVPEIDGFTWRNWNGNADITGTIKREIEFLHE